MSKAEQKDVVDFLARNPEIGDVLPGTGGVRKARVPGRGKGKRGGFREIYYYMDDNSPLYALLIYGKDEQDDLTPDQRKAVRTIAEVIRTARRRK